MMDRVVSAIERVVFGNRRLILALFAVVSVFMVYQVAHLRIDAVQQDDRLVATATGSWLTPDASGR